MTSKAIQDLKENDICQDNLLAILDMTNAHSPAVAGSLVGIAGAYEKLGENQKALEHYNKALEIYNLEPNLETCKLQSAGCLNNIGFIYENLGKI